MIVFVKIFDFRHCFFVIGFYWIDPNQGNPEDAVFAYCDFLDGGKTCVYPDEHSRSVSSYGIPC